MVASHLAADGLAEQASHLVTTGIGLNAVMVSSGKQAERPRVPCFSCG